MDDRLIMAIVAMGGFIVLVWRFGSEIVKLLVGSYVRTNEQTQQLFAEHITEQTSMLRDLRQAMSEHDGASAKAHLQAAEILERVAAWHNNGTRP